MDPYKYKQKNTLMVLWGFGPTHQSKVLWPKCHQPGEPDRLLLGRMLVKVALITKDYGVVEFRVWIWQAPLNSSWSCMVLD